jgi:hypothetical protein
VLYGRPGSEEPTYGEVVQAGIRANSATESAVSGLPSLPQIAPAAQAIAPEYAAAAGITHSNTGQLSRRPSRHVYHGMRRHRRMHRIVPTAPLQLQTSIVPASQ